VVIMATIPLLEHDAQEHNWTAVSLWFSGHSSLYRISIMGVLYCYYHLFSQNFTGQHDTRAHKLLEGWRAAIAVEINDGPLTSISNS